MKLRLIFILLSLSASLHAATWYATSSSVNINAASLWVPTSTGSCTGSGTPLTFGNQLTGDIFSANGCTALAVNVDPGSVSKQITLSTAANGGTAGGGFTYATATNITMHIDLLGGTTTVLTVTGTTGGGTVSFVTITGGSVANQNGITDTHSSVTMTYTGGTATGGSVTNQGILVNSTSAGTTNISGTAIGGTAGAANSYGVAEAAGSGTQTTTFTGTCQGSASSGTGAGCAGTSVVPLRVVGKIVASPRSVGASGAIIYTPAATDYALFAKDTSYVTGVIDTHATETPTDPGISNVKTGTAYGSFTGTLPNGGVAACTGTWQ